MGSIIFKDLKSLYDKYGLTPGRGAAMTHYIYDVDKRESKKMDLSLDMDQVLEDTGCIDYIREESSKQKSNENIELSININQIAKDDKNVDEVRKRREPSDDKLLDDFIKVRELKKEIDNAEAKLNQMRAEYEQLKEEFIEWL